MSKQEKLKEIAELIKRKSPAFHKADGLPSLTFEETRHALMAEDYFQVLKDIDPIEQDKQIAQWVEFLKRPKLYQHEAQKRL